MQYVYIFVYLYCIILNIISIIIIFMLSVLYVPCNQSSMPGSYSRPLGRLDNFREISTLTVVHEDAQPAMFMQAVSIAHDVGMLEGLGQGLHHKSSRILWWTRGPRLQNVNQILLYFCLVLQPSCQCRSCSRVRQHPKFWSDQIQTQPRAARSLLSLSASSKWLWTWCGELQNLMLLGHVSLPAVQIRSLAETRVFTMK